MISAAGDPSNQETPLLYWQWVLGELITTATNIATIVTARTQPLGEATFRQLLQVSSHDRHNNLSGGCHYHPHCTDEVTEAQRHKVTCLRHRGREWQSWELNLL